MKKLLGLAVSLLVIGAVFTGCGLSKYYSYEDGKVHSNITGNSYDKEDAKKVISSTKKAVGFFKNGKEEKEAVTSQEVVDSF